MSVSRQAIAWMVALGVVHASPANADQPEYYDWNGWERHEHWSWAPLASVLAAYDTSANAFAPLYSAEIRFRHGKSLDSHHDEETGLRVDAEDPKLVTFGVSVQSLAFDTLEPAALFGYHYLPTEWDYSRERPWLDLRADVRLGYAWADNDAGFAAVRLGLGIMFTQSAKQLLGGVEGHLARFRSQLDLIVQGQAGFAGDWRIAVGIELDPIRIFGDIAAM